MRLTQLSLANPAAIIVVAALVIMLGLLSIFRVPAQLLPNIEKPVITVVNAWPGRRCPAAKYRRAGTEGCRPLRRERHRCIGCRVRAVPR